MGDQNTLIGSGDSYTRHANAPPHLDDLRIPAFKLIDGDHVRHAEV
jgi:hypothetical protein